MDLQVKVDFKEDDGPMNLIKSASSTPELTERSLEEMDADDDDKLMIAEPAEESTKDAEEVKEEDVKVEDVKVEEQKAVPMVEEETKQSDEDVARPDEVEPEKGDRAESPSLKRKKKRKLMPGFDTKVRSRTEKKPKPFIWSEYLTSEKVRAAPPSLFINGGYPSTKVGFRVGMWLEGLDPKHPSEYCVLVIMEIKGYRLRLHFEGYSECYDFWANADSFMIFPPGWCDKNKKSLNPPKGIDMDPFSWSAFLKKVKGVGAPKALFHHLNLPVNQQFRIGQKLEAVDKRNTKLTCVATVADIVGSRILVHFDGWEQVYDFWCESNSPFIHPVGWCQETGNPLSPPPDWPDISTFTWKEYLEKTSSQAASSRAFKTRREPVAFEVNQKLECVDKRNPLLLRVATVTELDGYMVKIHFDGWSDQYDIWMEDDSPDLHPVDWCSRTGTPLQPPLAPEDLCYSPSQQGCPTPGCKGYGHVKGPKYNGHHSAFGCPYSASNMNKPAVQLGDRLSSRAETDVRPLRIEPDGGKCPTPGCDGSGHISGKFNTHYTASGCPLAESNKHKLPVSSSAQPQVPPVKIPRPKGRPPGSGRGRKKFKFTNGRENGFPSARPGGESAERLRGASGDSAASSQLRDMIHQSVFAPNSPAHANSAPALDDVRACFDHNARILPELEHAPTHRVQQWTNDDVIDYVRALGLDECELAFREEGIDGEALLLLNQTDLINRLRLRVGHALKLYSGIVVLREMSDDLED